MTSQTDNTPPPPPQPGERADRRRSNRLTSRTSPLPSQDVGSTITSATLLSPPTEGENGEPFTTIQPTPGQWTTPLLAAVPREVITEPVANHNGFDALATDDASSAASDQPVANISHPPQATAPFASLLQDISIIAISTDALSMRILDILSKGALAAAAKFDDFKNIDGRGVGGKNVIFSNGPNSTSECINLLY
jgi:hypothetical protein